MRLVYPAPCVRCWRIYLYRPGRLHGCEPRPVRRRPAREYEFVADAVIGGFLAGALAAVLVLGAERLIGRPS